MSGPSTSKEPQAKKKKYDQNYKSSWEECYPWLTKDQSGNARCKVCHTVFTKGSNKADLGRHEKSAKHRNAVEAGGQKLSMKSFFPVEARQRDVDKETALAECKIVGFMAEHDTPFRHADHLSPLLSQCCPDSKIAKNIRMKRTKASYLMQYGIAYREKKELTEILKGQKFSVLVDESTDVSVSQILAVVVRFYDKTQKATVDALYTTIEVEDATAHGLYTSLKNALAEDDIPMENIIGLAADNCSTMMGTKNGFQALMKRDVGQHLFVMGCVCHSLALAANDAAKVLPSWLEQLLRDISSTFSRSAKRTGELKLIQEALETVAHRVLKISKTRWLSRGEVIRRIIEQWEPLLLFYQSQCQTEKLPNDPEERTKLQSVYVTMKTTGTYHMLLFLNYILPKIDQLNLQFQAKAFKLHKLHDTINSGYKEILSCFMRDDMLKGDVLPSPLSVHAYKPLGDLHVGGRCAAELATHPLKEKEVKFRQDCQKFLVKVCDQMNQRFSLGKESVLSKLRCLDPTATSDKSRPVSLIPIATKFPSLVKAEDLDTLEDQWRSLPFFAEQLPQPLETNPEKFWATIAEIEDANDKRKFDILGPFMMDLMALPHSTATVERVFSQVNQIKTAKTNRLHAATVCNRMLAKQHLHRQNADCLTWNPHPSILTDITSGACHKRYTDSMTAAEVNLVYDVDGVVTEDGQLVIN